jgi:DNA-directed RNA polymerase specialized sigma24 family protein
MDRAAAIAELPHAYATALRLREQGLDDESIANHLNMEIEAVGPLLRLASDKLDHLLATSRSAAPRGSEADSL